MATRFKLGDIPVDVVLKDIKNIHLSVYPPAGSGADFGALAHEPGHDPRVRDLEAGLDQAAAEENPGQERETPREYLERESHYVWGRRYLLQVVECDEPPSVELKHSGWSRRCAPEPMRAQKQAVVEDWYRAQIKAAAAAADRQVGAGAGREGRTSFRSADEDQMGKLQRRRRAASVSTPIWRRSQPNAWNTSWCTRWRTS